MKRLLATTAVGLFLASGPAFAAGHDIWTITQDFDILNGVPGDQNVINNISGVDVNVTQTGSNLGNSFSIQDPGQETGTLGDDYVVDQIFDEVQSVTNTVSATDEVTATQSGTNIVNLGNITDAFGGTDNGDTYDIEQLASSDLLAEAGAQTVENSITNPASVTGSSQSGTVQANALTITDSVGGTVSAGTLTVNQQAALVNDFDQYVNNTVSATSINGLEQSGETKANLLTLALSNQSGGVMVNVTQNTTEDFDQSVNNQVAATVSALNVSQSGSNAANVITWGP